MADVTYKVLITVSGLAASRAAKVATRVTWKSVTGSMPPVNRNHPNYSALRVAMYALIASGLAGGFKVFAQRSASDFYTKTAGHLPPTVIKAQQEAEAERKAEAKANGA